MIIAQRLQLLPPPSFCLPYVSLVLNLLPFYSISIIIYLNVIRALFCSDHFLCNCSQALTVNLESCVFVQETAGKLASRTHMSKLRPANPS